MIIPIIIHKTHLKIDKILFNLYYKKLSIDRALLIGLNPPIDIRKTLLLRFFRKPLHPITSILKDLSRRADLYVFTPC